MPAEPGAGTRLGRAHVIGAASEIRPGERRIVEVAGRSIGVFNVDGWFHALGNTCPHKGGPLCAGRVTGTVLEAVDHRFVYGREGEILRCALHGWEFEIATGRALADPRFRARTYPVEVRDGQLVVTV